MGRRNNGRCVSKKKVLNWWGVLESYLGCINNNSLENKVTNRREKLHYMLCDSLLVVNIHHKNDRKYLSDPSVKRMCVNDDKRSRRKIYWEYLIKALLIIIASASQKRLKDLSWGCWKMEEVPISF